MVMMSKHLVCRDAEAVLSKVSEYFGKVVEDNGVLVDCQENSKLIPRAEAERKAEARTRKEKDLVAPEDIEYSVPWYQAMSRKHPSLPRLTQIADFRKGPVFGPTNVSIYRKYGNVFKPIIFKEDISIVVYSKPEYHALAGNAKLLAKAINAVYYGPSEVGLRQVLNDFTIAMNKHLAEQAGTGPAQPAITEKNEGFPVANIMKLLSASSGMTKTQLQRVWDKSLEHDARLVEAISLHALNSSNAINALAASNAAGVEANKALSGIADKISNNAAAISETAAPQRKQWKLLTKTFLF